LKTLKDSDVFPVLLVTTAMLTWGFVLQKRFRKLTVLMRCCTSTVFFIFIALFHSQGQIFLLEYQKVSSLCGSSPYNVHNLF
jgi:hypothetical protein